MKQIHLLFMILMISITGLTAQDETDYDDGESAFTKLYIGASFDPYGVEEGNIVGLILDDSPSMDWLFIDVNIKESKRAYGVHFGFEKSYSNRLTWKVDGNVFLNSDGQAAAFGFGGGYRIGNQKFHLIPMVRTGIGGGKIELGTIENQSSYIQFDEEKYYGTYMDSYLRSIYGYIGTELNMSFAISERVGLQLSASYKFSKNIRNDLVFEGWEDGQNSEEGKSFRELSHERNNILLDGEPINENQGLIKLRGLAFKISYVKYLDF